MSTVLERSPHLWFSDCGLVIRAQQTLFRLSGQMLSARSCVFADMLSFPQPAGSETIDGCPVVHLEDSAEDLTVFFRALFEYEFFQPHPVETDFPTIRGVLRLSQKYQVENLRKRALVHLDSMDLRLNDQIPAPRASWTPKRDFLPEIIALCREVSALWLLPTAYVRISRSFTDKEVLLGRSTNGIPITFSSEDKINVISGNLALRTQVFTRFLEFLNPLEALAGCPPSCRTWRVTTRVKADGLRDPESVGGMFTPLAITKPTPGLCEKCQISLAQKYKAACVEVDVVLPGIFGLPERQVLDDMRARELT